jgi:hypothetical protein
MATKATTSKSVNQVETSGAQLKKELDAAKKAFSDAPTKTLTIPAVFKKTFGSEMFIGINGVFVNVPVDGKGYEVPEPFYEHAMQAINSL